MYTLQVLAIVCLIFLFPVAAAFPGVSYAFALLFGAMFLVQTNDSKKKFYIALAILWIVHGMYLQQWFIPKTGSYLFILPSIYTGILFLISVGTFIVLFRNN